MVEQALLFFMESRRELPDEALIPTRIVLGNAAFDRLMKAKAPAPTKALRDLMHGR